MVILKTPPPSLKQAGSVLLPMVNYSLGGDGGTTVIGVKNRASIWRSRLFSSWRISTSALRTRYCSQNWSVTLIASVAAGKALRSGTAGTAPCILWEKARWRLTDPTKVGLLGPSPLVACPPWLRRWAVLISSLTLRSMSALLAATSSLVVQPAAFHWFTSLSSSRRRLAA